MNHTWITMKNTTTARARIGQFAMAFMGHGQQVVGTLSDATFAAKREGVTMEHEVIVVKREGEDTYRVIAFFCPIRRMVVATSRALPFERAQIEADFGVAPRL